MVGDSANCQGCLKTLVFSKRRTGGLKHWSMAAPIAAGCSLLLQTLTPVSLFTLELWKSGVRGT